MYGERGLTVCVYDEAKLHTHCLTKRYTLCVWYELKELNYVYTSLVRLIHIVCVHVCVHVLVCVNI